VRKDRRELHSEEQDKKNSRRSTKISDSLREKGTATCANLTAVDDHSQLFASFLTNKMIQVVTLLPATQEVPRNEQPS
jgi:hypothetical protein